MSSSLLRLGTGLIAAIVLSGCAAESGPEAGLDGDNEESVEEAREAVTFTSLGGTLAVGSGVGAASWGPGRLDVFARGGNDALWHKASTNNGSTWSDWESLGGVINSDPAAVSWASGRIDVIARGGTQLWHRAYDTSINGWTGWASLGGTATSGPAIASRGAGNLDVIVNGGATLWQRSFSTTTGTWSDWGNLGDAFTSDPAAVSWGPGRLDVFGRGADNTLMHRGWDQATGWSNWESLGGTCSSGPAVTSDAPGHLDVFVRGGDTLWRRAYRSGTWSDWINMGQNLTSDPEAIASGGQISLFGRGGDGTLVTSVAPPYQVPDSSVGQFFHANDGTHPPPLSYGRGAGTVLDTCPAGLQKDGALCYPQCNPGYYGVGPVCWQTCPSGYTDTGALCTYSGGPLVVACDWSWSSFSCSCPANYTNTGLSCAANTIAKASYGRGAGTPLICNSSLQQDGALCYPRCDPGYHGVGPVCWLDSGNIQNACASLYDSTLASFATAQGWTTTYGFGAGVAVGASAAVEAGVVYGKEGHFGCYVQTCGGVTTDVGFQAWGSFAKSTLGFESVSGTTVLVKGGDPKPPNWGFGPGVGLESATVLDPSGQDIRAKYNFTLGNMNMGIPFPWSASALTCQTFVTQLW